MKKLMISFFTLFFLFFSFSLSYNINISNFAQTIGDKVIGIHFGGGGNDFGGLLIVTDRIELKNPEIVSAGGKSIKCTKKLNGYYWNNMRGQIIYPLNKESRDFWNNKNNSFYNGLNISGGFYTNCDGNINSIYGKITYSSPNIYNFSLQAGTKYNTNTNKPNISSFSNNLQIYNKKTIVGLIYDSTYGIAFVGGHVDRGWNDLTDTLNTKTVNDTVNEITKDEIKTKLASVHITPSLTVRVEGILGVLGIFNISGKKTEEIKNEQSIIQKANDAVLGGDNISNVSSYINSSKQNVSKLCRNSWNNISSDLSLGTTSMGKISCIKASLKTIKVVDNLADGSKPTNIVIQGKNNKIVFSTSQYGHSHVNLFMDNGYVLFDNDDGNLKEVGINGNLDGNSTKAFVFKGNLLVNGLIAGYNLNGDIEKFKHKLYVNGSLASLNTIGENNSREDYLKKDLLKSIYKEDTMNLNKHFIWNCKSDGKGSDGINCDNKNDKYNNNAIVVLQNKLENLFIK